MNKVVALISVAFIAAGCSRSPQPASEIPAGLPVVTARVGDLDIPGTVGSYCWFETGSTEQKVGKCVDKASPLELVRKVSPTVVSAGSSLRFVFSQIPTGGDIFVWDKKGQHRLDLADDGTLTLAARGGYVIEVSTRWKEGQSATYVYKVEAR